MRSSAGTQRSAANRQPVLSSTPLPVLVCVCAGCDAEPEPGTGTEQAPELYYATHLALQVIRSFNTATADVLLGGWIRAGGLWRLAGPPAGADADGGAVEKGEDEETRVARPVDALSAPMWFDHGPSREYWVSRGGAACGTLGIVVIRGLEKQARSLGSS
jgi:hypothetical protein